MTDQLRFYAAMSVQRKGGRGMSNLSLWEKVQSTDPKYTKQYKGAGGFSGTAINATYIVKRLSETYGPVGSGWGYEILDERVDQGGPILNKDGEARSEEHTPEL